MSHYNPEIHHRRSIRLKGYDYASEGLYFVTMCVQNRECLFGEIKNDEMVLNDAGRMVEKWYRKTQDKFPDIICHEMVIMPNHFHCIWENVGSSVGADPCVRPVEPNNKPIVGNNNCVVDEDAHANVGAHAGAPLRMNDTDLDEHTGSPLSAMVRWFKTMSTNEYIRGVKQLGWPPFDRKLWQRNYYEHIIRDDASLQSITHYIVNNPAQWQEDDFYQPPKMI
jgi:REP element-mobilizing transposase RayT